jgi:acetyltransferase-like isoleucine patch superfamily enzyme
MATDPAYNRYQIGIGTYGTPTVLSWSPDDQLTIGKFCSIAGGVTIFLNGEHRTDWVSTFPFAAYYAEARHLSGHPLSKGPVVIGNDVWIAANAIILSGIKVGDGAVIGAGAVVSRNVPPYTIVAGNPAKPIRQRFTDEQVEHLLRLKWWDLHIEQVKKLTPLLMSNRIDDLIDILNRGAA